MSLVRISYTVLIEYNNKMSCLEFCLCYSQTPQTSKLCSVHRVNIFLQAFIACSFSQSLG